MTSARQARREEHEAVLLRQLRAAGALGRGELARRTGLPRSSVFALVGELLRRGVLVERAEPADTPRGRGRPGVLVALDPAAGLIIGVDVGRGRIRLVVANVSHQVVATGAADVPTAGDGAEPSAAVAAVADAVAVLIRAVCAEHDLDLSALEAISVGLVGIPGLHPVAAQAETLCAVLSDAFGVHVLHGNNTRFAALAEATWGAGRRADDVLYVRWSTGVGGGFVLGGRAHVGANGAGAELGHVSVDPLGAECACGGRGCLELAIGGPALLARCRGRGLAVDDLDGLVAAAQSRVAVACDVVASAAELLGQVVAGAVVQIDPELVIIGGELGQLGSLVLGPVRAGIDRLAMPRLARRLSVVAADLGVSDAALGAVAHAVHATRGEPVRPTR